MDKKDALLKIGELLSVYDDEDWDFQVFWFINHELLQVEMIKKKVLGEE